jgi:hemerythrin-like domain-containing protein
MRINKIYRTDMDFILRFADALGGGTAILSASRDPHSGFFIFAHQFIEEYIHAQFFKKEELLIAALVDSGFPPDDGPIGALRGEQQKCRESAEHLLKAAKEWQAGEHRASADVGWASSEYTSTLRRHLDRLKNLIFPLLEQNLSEEDEYKILEGLNNIAFENSLDDNPDKYTKLIEALDEELSEWK